MEDLVLDGACMVTIVTSSGYLVHNEPSQGAITRSTIPLLGLGGPALVDLVSCQAK